MDCIVSEPEYKKTVFNNMRKISCKTLISLLITTGLSANFLKAQQVVPVPARTDAVNILYYSKQEKKSSQTSGYYEKTTDKYERGSVELSIKGPIKYSVSPPELSIEPNSSKTWNGIMSCNPEMVPEPGTKAIARMEARYDWTFSRSVGSGTGGKVLKEQTCQPFDPSGANNCAYHPQGSGRHEIVNFTGSEDFDFEVYSIKVSLPDTIYAKVIKPTVGGTIISGVNPSPVTSKDNTLSLVPEENARIVGKVQAEAVSFPETGGTFLWEVLTDNVEITDNKIQNPYIILKDASTPGKIRVNFTIGGVSYQDEAFVKICQCDCYEKEHPVLNFIPVIDDYMTPSKLNEIDSLRLEDLDPVWNNLASSLAYSTGTHILTMKILLEYAKRCSGWDFSRPLLMPYKADDDIIALSKIERRKFLKQYAIKSGVPADGQFHCVRIRNWLNAYLLIKPIHFESYFISTPHSLDVFGSYEIKLSNSNIDPEHQTNEMKEGISEFRNINLNWCISDDIDANGFEEYKNKWIKLKRPEPTNKPFYNLIENIKYTFANARWNTGGMLEILLGDKFCDYWKDASFLVRVYFKEEN
jgi:hypothetical protein